MDIRAGANADISPSYSGRGLAVRYLSVRYFPAAGVSADGNARICYTLQRLGSCCSWSPHPFAIACYHSPFPVVLLQGALMFYKEHDMSGHALPPPRPKQTPFWSTAADEELIYAKKEIVNAPLVSGDLDLYAPLFQSVSILKRSYELMESLLKVFMYHDGA